MKMLGTCQQLPLSCRIGRCIDIRPIWAIIGRKKYIVFPLIVTKRCSPLTTSVNGSIDKIIVGRVRQFIKHVTDDFPVHEIFRPHDWGTRHQVHSSTHHIIVVTDPNYVHIRNISINHRISKSRRDRSHLTTSTQGNN